MDTPQPSDDFNEWLKKAQTHTFNAQLKYTEVEIVVTDEDGNTAEATEGFWSMHDGKVVEDKDEDNYATE